MALGVGKGVLFREVSSQGLEGFYYKSVSPIVCRWWGGAVDAGQCVWTRGVERGPANPSRPSSD